MVTTLAQEKFTRKGWGVATVSLVRLVDGQFIVSVMDAGQPVQDATAPVGKEEAFVLFDAVCMSFSDEEDSMFPVVIA